MKKTKSIKRILAGALAALMSISAVPMAFAAEKDLFPAEGITVTAPEELVVANGALSGNPQLTVRNGSDQQMTDVTIQVTGGVSVSLPTTINAGATQTAAITGTPKSGQQIYEVSYKLNGSDTTYKSYGFSYLRATTTAPYVLTTGDSNMSLRIDPTIAKGVLDQTAQSTAAMEASADANLYIDRSQGTTWQDLGFVITATEQYGKAPYRDGYQVWSPGGSWNGASFGLSDAPLYTADSGWVYNNGWNGSTKFAGHGVATHNINGNVPNAGTTTQLSMTFVLRWETIFGKWKANHTLNLTIITVDKAELRSAVTAAAAKNYQAADYTTATYDTFYQALVNAYAVLGNFKSTQAQINDAKTQLDAAVKALKYAEANYTELDAAIASAQAILNDESAETVYTAESLEKLQSLYEAAVALKTPVLDFTRQDEIDAAAKALADAVASMVKFADYSKVEQALAVFSKLNASYYDEAELAAVTELADAATESLKNKLPEDQQAEVDQMAEDLLDAIAALELRDADTAKLAALYEDAMEILSSDKADTYTTASINALMEAVVAANEVLNAGLKIDQQAKVDAAEQELQNALTGLVKNPADKADLLTKLNEAKAIQGRSDYNDYTDDSRTALEAAIASAQAVYDNANLTVDDQAAITAEVTKLAAAIRGMSWKPADYSQLDAAIDVKVAEVAAAKEAVTAEGAKLYTAASIARVETAIELARSLARDLTVKDQSQVDDMITTLNSVPLEKNAADYAALNALIAEKQDLLNNAGDEYTEESKTALQSAITAARAVVAAQYKIDEQSKVNDAVAALKAVELALKDADFSALDAAIQAAEEFLADPETDKLYTPDAIQAVKDALAEAEAVRGEYLTILDQDKVAAAATALNGAVAAAKGNYNPANVETLEAAISAANAKLNAEDIADYTEASVQALKDAVAKAEALIAETPDITRQDEVNAMADELNGMTLTLKPADKAALEDAINAVEDMLADSADYTEEFIKELEDALEDAYGVLEDDSLTIKDQDKVNEVVKDLTGKTEQPVYKDAVLTALDAAIAAAQAKIDAPDYQNYTEASRAVLEAALAEAVALRESNPNITQQAAVDAAAEKLNSVKLTLKGANYDDLNAAIAEVEALLGTNLSDTYTNASIADLEKALEEAKNIAAGDYDASQQEIIDGALQALVNAKDALKTYTKVGNVTILGGDYRDGQKIYHKTPWYQTYKSQKAELYVEIENPEDVVDIKWEAANWSIDEPEATITDNGDGTATIQPNGKGIGARSMWVKVTVTDVNGNVSTDIVKVRFYNWDWQK